MRTVLAAKPFLDKKLAHHVVDCGNQLLVLLNLSASNDPGSLQQFRIVNSQDIEAEWCMLYGEFNTWHPIPTKTMFIPLLEDHVEEETLLWRLFVDVPLRMSEGVPRRKDYFEQCFTSEDTAPWRLSLTFGNAAAGYMENLVAEITTVGTLGGIITDHRVLQESMVLTHIEGLL